MSPQDETTRSIELALGASIELAAPYAGEVAEVRYDHPRYDPAQELQVILGPIIATTTVTGWELLVQLDAYSTEPTGALVNAAADRLNALLLRRERVAGGLLPAVPGGTLVFTSVRPDPATTRDEPGPGDTQITRILLQYRIRAHDTGRAHGQF
jgi:hypothetical protein